MHQLIRLTQGPIPEIEKKYWEWVELKTQFENFFFEKKNIFLLYPHENQ